MSNVVIWIARLLGLALMLLFLIIAFGEGLPSPANMTLHESLAFVGLILMLAGVALGWRRELPGGLVILGGYIVFAVANQEVIVNWIFGMFPLCGLLFLCAWWLHHRHITTTTQ